jgi:PAS domain S-box-containing protein
MVEDIDNQKAAQAQLVESEEKFLKAFHGNPNPSLLTRIADGRILEANQAFTDWFCVTKVEAENRTTFDFGIWRSFEERERLLTQLRRTGVIRNHELSLALPSGATRTVLLALQLLQLRGMECLLTITTDVTPLKEAERALRRSEERLRLGLQAARMGAWEWDVAKNSITWSREVHTLFGLPEGGFGGHFDAFLELVVPEDRQRVELEIKRALEHPEFPYYTEVRTRWSDGSLHWIEARGEVRTNPEGKVFALLGTVVDITDRKELEASLRAAQERELKAREEFSRHLLSALEQERQSLAAELHDSIGQNLSLITNQAHLARADGAVPPGISERLEAISRFTSDAIAEVRNLVRNLRPVQIEQVGLTDSVRELIERVFNASGLKVRSRIENVDEVLSGPAATHVYRILQEAIHNIIKHASATNVTLELERDIRSIRLRIVDDGVGFKVAVATRKGGLGLTSISERAAILGGVAQIVSNPREGTRMLVEIPIPGFELHVADPSI